MADEPISEYGKDYDDICSWTAGRVQVALCHGNFIEAQTIISEACWKLSRFRIDAVRDNLLSRVEQENDKRMESLERYVQQAMDHISARAVGMRKQ